MEYIEIAVSSTVGRNLYNISVGYISKYGRINRVEELYVEREQAPKTISELFTKYKEDRPVLEDNRLKSDRAIILPKE